MLDEIIGRDLAEVAAKIALDPFEGKAALITGGAGFIGSWLCDLLIMARSRTFCLDDLSTGRMENVEHLAGSGDFHFVEADVSGFDAKDENFDLILHLASRAAPEDYQLHPIEALAANSEGTKRMLELARRNDSTILYASSSEVYGDAEVIPTPETYWGRCDPIGHRSCYGEGKRFGEALCTAYYRAYGLDVRVVRIFNTYGPRLRGDGHYARALSRFIGQALDGRDITVYGSGDQTRSYCYIRDAISGILLALNSKEMKGGAVNIGNPQEISILELAKKVNMFTKSASKITFHPRPEGDPQRRCPNIDKARSILNWSPSVPLDEGLKMTIAWFRQARAKKA